MAMALRSTLNEPPKSKLLYYRLLAVYFEQYLHAGGIVFLTEPYLEPTNVNLREEGIDHMQLEF